MDISEAHVLGLFLRTFLYGVYFTVFLHCLRWLFFVDEGWKLRPTVNRTMLTITLLVFAFTTVNIWIWHQLALSAIRGQAIPDYRLLLASNGLERATTLMIDAMLVYRCWIVYYTSWRAIFFPLILLLSNVAIFIISFAYATTTGDLNMRLAEAFYSCNIAINLYATSAIIYQILRVTKRSSRSSDFYEICRILAECGLPYMCTSVFALTVTIIATETYLFPTACALVRAYSSSTVNGIAFNCILIRVGRYRADRDT
ncbi:hypothetical protein M378DRAFT_131686 [Amanita muscaria Koide BX008]|uniref:Uncharacterized protein n=1 Tax=Amanita muscaria (strain Koide BX008) TaxID=946122 RepID=A0A0C2S8R9_AMAMK|nr:hypothetical protein M378DRAFT_131686 [Amanita muscaria Koide BX008]